VACVIERFQHTPALEKKFVQYASTDSLSNMSKAGGVSLAWLGRCGHAHSQRAAARLYGRHEEHGDWPENSLWRDEFDKLLREEEPLLETSWEREHLEVSGSREMEDSYSTIDATFAHRWTVKVAVPSDGLAAKRERKREAAS